MTTQFEKDEQVMLSVNGSPMSKATWNLLLSKRDVGLFTKGLKPHRNWKFNTVKAYFGLKGDKHSVYAQLCEMVKATKNEQQEPTR